MKRESIRTVLEMAKAPKRLLLCVMVAVVAGMASGCLSINVHHETEHPVVVPDDHPTP